MKGGATDFTPYDLVIEHTVKDVKVTTRPKGPYNNWEVMRQRGPAIPTLRTLGAHMEDEFPSISRRVKHSVPAKDRDVKLLRQHYETSAVYAVRKRKVESEDKIEDYLTKGFDESAKKLLPGWIERRGIYKYATRQAWGPYPQPQEASAQEPGRGSPGDRDSVREMGSEGSGRAGSV